jgi:hypothetical protein
MLFLNSYIFNEAGCKKHSEAVTYPGLLPLKQGSGNGMMYWDFSSIKKISASFYILWNDLAHSIACSDKLNPSFGVESV